MTNGSRREDSKFGTRQRCSRDADMDLHRSQIDLEQSNAAPTNDAFGTHHPVVMVDHVSGEQPLSQRWDSLSPQQRIDELETQLHGALLAIDRNQDVVIQRARADAALSALRGELYSTEAGRARYQMLEQDLDAANERHRIRARKEGPQ